MTYKERYNYLKGEEKQAQAVLINARKQLKAHSLLMEITFSDLAAELSDFRTDEAKATRGFNIEYVNQKYEKILGGDGRSQPWSEEVDGVVLHIYTKYYLVTEQRNIIRNYFKSLKKYDELRFYHGIMGDLLYTITKTDK